MSKETIQYLIKFTKEKTHAEDLLAGKFFMRPSVAFVKMFYDEFFKTNVEFSEENFSNYVNNYNGCIGDFTEARLVGQQSIKANINIPIFCLSYISSSQINNKKITFDKKFIDEFINSEYKYAVLIKFDEFEKMLLNYMDNKKNIGGFGPVKYTKLNKIEEMKDCFSNMKYGKNLLYKDSYFHKQKEFRIYLNYAEERYSAITYKDSYKLYKTDIKDLEFKNAVELNELPYHIEIFDSIEKYAKIIPITQFLLNGEKYCLNIGETNE